MGAKYLPTIRDQKAAARFRLKQARQAKPKPPATGRLAKPGAPK